MDYRRFVVLGNLGKSIRRYKMRVRYEKYRNGQSTGIQCECDLSKRKAKKLFKDLKSNLLCGWAELVGEYEDEGGYMEIIDSFDNISRAEQMSKFVYGLGKLGGAR